MVLESRVITLLSLTGAAHKIAASHSAVLKAFIWIVASCDRHFSTVLLIGVINADALSISVARSDF